MLALWQSTLASMFAPGLALRGPPGSMDMAVNQLIEEYQGAMRLFVVSVFLFMTTALLWCARSQKVAGQVFRVRITRLCPHAPAHARRMLCVVRRSWTWNSWITSAVGTIMVLTTMRMTYVTIVNVADEFDVDPNYTPEYNFRDGATGGWAPPEDARSLSSQAGTRNTLADLDATQARLSKAGHARQPWYARNRTLQAFVNPLLLPTPMSLY